MRHPRPSLASLCALTLALALGATQAQAAQTHLFAKSFAPTAGFTNPLGLAINQSTEEVYVADLSKATVYAFAPDGAEDPTHPQLTEADGTTPYPFVNPFGVAVDNSAGPNHGDIYVSDPATATVSQFGPSGARSAQAPITAADVPPEGSAQAGGLPDVANNGSFAPTGVAVAANGDLDVADASNSVVDRFEPDGSFLAQLGAGQLAGPNLIALAPSGDLYVAGALGLLELSPTGTCLDACTPLDPATVYGVATDAAGNVYADDGSHVSEFDSAGNPIGTFATPSPGSAPPFGGLSGTSFGLAINEATGSIYLADFGAATADVFGPLVTVPDASTEAATALTPVAATLNATVDADGGGDAACHFEYVSDAAFSTEGGYAAPSTATVPCATDPVSGSGPTAVSAAIAGLSPATSYHFRVVANDGTGGDQLGADELLATPAAVTALSTDTATELTPTRATLNGSFTGVGLDTHYYFEWGATLSYGNTTGAAPALDAGTTTGPTSVSAEITGLGIYAIYHYRIIATNEFGTTAGPDQTFISAPPALAAVDSTFSSAVTKTEATLGAQVNPGFGLTIYRFEYGTDTSYPSSTPYSEPIGSDDADYPVSVHLSGLSPATTYHFRVRAINFSGVTVGPDRTFTTQPSSGAEGPAASNSTPSATTPSPPPSAPPTRSAKCRAGTVRRHGKCVPKSHRKPHHNQGGAR